MLKELKKSICLISSFFLIGCNQKTIFVVKGEPVNDSIKIYAPECYIKNTNQEILINEGFFYKNNLLQKYVTPQTESLIIENVQQNGYNKETEAYKKLNYKEIGSNEVILFNKKYKIERKSADTIFLNNNIIIIKNFSI